MAGAIVQVIRPSWTLKRKTSGSSKKKPSSTFYIKKEANSVNFIALKAILLLLTTNLLQLKIFAATIPQDKFVKRQI